jgi:hypothetical protein
MTVETAMFPMAGAARHVEAHRGCSNMARRPDCRGDTHGLPIRLTADFNNGGD